MNLNKPIYLLTFISLLIFQPIYISNTLYTLFFITYLLLTKKKNLKKVITLTIITIIQINPLNLYLRSLLFHITFIATIFFYSFIGSGAILFSKYIYTLNLNILPKILAKHILFLCSALININVKIKGNLPKNEIIAPQHQSFLEIIILAAYLDNAKFVFADSFLNVPFLGYCMKNLNMIPVDRTKYNPNWMNQAIEVLNQNNNLIIFPEGGRIKYGQIVEYKKGVFKLAQKMHKDIIPVYTNTGLFWPKNAFILKPGIAKLYFGERISPTPENLRKALYYLANE